jgi:D-glycero-D-manno-heptose 1,7-bisphosphate phosphatase
MTPAAVTPPSVTPRAARHRFALLDRDGTINEEVDHLSHPGELRLIAGSADAIRRLRAEGIDVVVVTNQANVGRGVLAPEMLDRIHDCLRSMLAREGAYLDAILHCPHAPEHGCACRKPSPGMAFEAARRLGVDAADAFVVGDHAGDMALGRAVGATTFLVLTGHGTDQRAGAERDRLVDHVVANLAAAADVITALVRQETA